MVVVWAGRIAACEELSRRLSDTVQSLQVPFDHNTVVPGRIQDDNVSDMFCIDDGQEEWCTIVELVTYFFLWMVCQQLLALAVGPDRSS